MAPKQKPRPPLLSTTALKKEDTTALSPGWSHVSPDELFVRFTIPEIRSVQGKLRAEADAKQEELRLMVGERYRDLLQASASIMSIANSSNDVISALSEMREVMAPDEDGSKPRRSSVRRKDDVHLKTLQSLAAHLKLLLDAPEHLWRLLERKQHLQAAWLFLLARVVHRALIAENPEEGWELEGINVTTQFPLVRRQWDTVVQFRSQIAHRATQHLREPSISSETACSTVLTLHLLDSLPLSETLSTLLSQRSRTLSSLRSHNLNRPLLSRSGSPSKGRLKDGDVADKRLSAHGSVSRKMGQFRDIVKTTRMAILEMLDIISGTMCIAKDVFRAENGKRSLVERALQDIQSDTPPKSVLTTSSLLSTLPSSTHLLTLPPSILSYKPYIDLTSPSTGIANGVLDAKLSAWFDNATQAFTEHINILFERLETIRDVWRVRRTVLQKLQTSRGIEETEGGRLRAALDGSVKQRVCEVMQTALNNVVDVVDGALRRAVQNVTDESEEVRCDVTPSTFLLSPSPIPSVSQLDMATASFKSFKNALRQRAQGRTPSLDKFLIEIESKADEIGEDLEVMNERSETSFKVRQQIMTAHSPAVKMALRRVIEILEKLFSSQSNDPGGHPDKFIVVVFLGRISHSLASSSFSHSLHCPEETLKDFRDDLEVLHERSISRWRAQAVSRSVQYYEPFFTTFKSVPPKASDSNWPSQPTSQLMNALLALASSLQQLGLSQSELHTKQITSNLMHDFEVAIAKECSIDRYVSSREHAQLLWDLTFLRRISDTHISHRENAEDPGDDTPSKVAPLRSPLHSMTQLENISELSAHIDHTIQGFLLRSQTLLAPLIGIVSPYKSPLVNGNALGETSLPRTNATVLLPLGTPILEQDFKPAMEIAKPSARFGLVSVGSITS